MAAANFLAAASVVPGAAAPDAGTSARRTILLDTVNRSFRAPLGLPPLAWSDGAARAAANHLAYWHLNGIGDGLAAHDETAGRRAFTGATPEERCRAAGVTLPCGEVAYPGTPLRAALAGWLSTPAHGLLLITARAVGCAGDRAGSVCDTVYGIRGTAAGHGTEPTVNGPRSRVRLWPYDGATGVPLTWNGAEMPDPLASFTGDRAGIGPVLFVEPPPGAVTITLTGPEGPVPLLAPGRQRAAARWRARTSGAWFALLAARRLDPGTAYHLTLREGGRSYTTRFTTVRGSG